MYRSTDLHLHGPFWAILDHIGPYWTIVLVKRVKRIWSSLRELFSKTILELFQKKNFFLSQFILLPEIATLSIIEIPRRSIFFILQCFFKVFHKSRILIELLEKKQNMKNVLLIFWCASGQLKLTSDFMGCYRVSLLNHKMLKNNILRTSWMHFCVYWTNKQTNKHKYLRLEPTHKKLMYVPI